MKGNFLVDFIPRSSVMGNLIANRYRLIRSLGKGGMGEVFLAHDTILDRKVAIKFLSQDLTQKKEFLQRFIREARITASLDHFNIVKVYDLLMLDNQYFLIMEYIEGYSLRDFIEKGKNKDLNLSLEIFLQILDGMDYAHSKGVVHRDLKPENIMLTKDNIVKITDFGIAFALGSHSITNPGVLMGTLAYLSPEQAQGINVDQQTDIYSLGVILYELLTSNLPIVSTNPASMIYKILNENPIPPTKYNPDIPPQIEKIISKCLQKDKKLRYQNVSQIKKEFENYFLSLKKEELYNQEIQEIQEIQDTQEIQEQEKKENTNELIQKTLGDILSEISSYKRNIQDVFYKNVEEYKEEYKIEEYKKEEYKIDFQGRTEKLGFIKPEQLNTYLSKAQKEYENKNYLETIRILELILPYYKSKNILYMLAKSHYKVGNLQKSLYYIDLHKRDYGENEKILSLEGDVLYNLKDFPNSYVSYYKVYEMTGDRLYLLLAAKSVVNYQPEVAIDHLSSIIPFEKDEHILSKSYKYMGLAYYKMGNYELAIQNWENYLKYYNDKEIIPSLIKSYKIAGKNLELAKIYSDLLQSSENQDVLKEALSFYLSTGKYKEAIEICYKLLSLNSDDLSVYQDMYLASKSINNTASLILAIENILRLHTELSLEAKIELMEELLILYQEEQQYWDAINIINQLMEIVGKKMEYSYQLADLLSKVEKYEEAINIMYELIGIDSSNALFYEKLAEIYHKSGQVEQAIQAIRTAISIDPSNYKYYKALSNFYLESGRIQEVVEILKNLIDYNPDELEAYILLAQIHLLLKNYSAAYEYILMAYSRANSREMEIPLKAFDIMLHSMAHTLKESQLINKFKEMAFEIKNPKYIPYLYFSISFFYWNKGFEVNSLEYLNNLLIISKNLDKSIYILANSMISYIKGRKKEAISYLEENQKVFKDTDPQIKKKYYELLIIFHLLNNYYSDNLEIYFKVLGEISDKYEFSHLILKAMFMERLAKNKADYLNALFLYEKAINEGFKDPHIIFRAFLINFVFNNTEKAKEYIKYLMEVNPTDPIYLHYYKQIAS